jgi:hypothetical protein
MAFINFQPSDYFNTKLYTGTGSAASITGVGFQPDFVWIKNRSTTFNHQINDAVRGVNKQIAPNLNNAQETNTGELTAFGSDGFTVGSGGTLNGSGNNIVSWNWKANGAGSSNTDGDITSTVSASTTSGFSIVKYTGNGSSGATVGHGLGSDVKMVMCKGLGDTYGWKVFHTNLTSGKTLVLQTTAAEDTDANRIASANASTFTTSGTFSVNESGSDYVAYCFAEKKGFSRFGSYVGNGSVSGTFIYTGFKPAFVLAKRTNAVESWVMFDNKRDPHNVVGHILHPNNNTVESDQTGGTLYVMDFLSNGFKLRGTDSLVNGSGSTYIYMCFAEAPLVSSNGIPAVAR